jgi:CubicO group peptidase (beta-lactamase class C family)
MSFSPSFPALGRSARPSPARAVGLLRTTAGLLLACLTLSTGAAAQAAAGRDRWDGVRSTIREFMQKEGVAAISVAVAKDGKIIWEEGFGWANREKMIPATANTMFSMASISKPYTATGLMTLVKEGKVDLDRPANDYLGLGKITGLAGDASQATVRRVLNHTAGLPLHYQFFYQDKGYQPPSMDETIARYAILVTAPGEIFNYSNLGYGIIDHIIERVSGQSYADYMRNEVFLPLGLTHTSIGIGPGLEAYAAERYDSHQRPIPFYTFDHLGASAVYSSAHDLVRFGMFHLKDHLPDQRAILPDALLDQTKVPSDRVAFGSGYALGWGIHKSDHGYPMVEHTGGMPGVNTTLNLYPTENLAIVVLTNAASGWGTIQEDIAGVMLKGYADSLKLERSQKKEPPKPTPFSAPAELQGTWTGTIRTWKETLPFELVISQGNDVQVQLGAAPAEEYDITRGKQLPALLTFPQYKDGNLTGRFVGRIPTEDAARWPHTISLDLRLVDGKLRGSASAQTGDDPLFYALTSYVELRKK